MTEMSSTPKNKRGNRKQEILESLAMMLESSPGNKITTAALAAQVGVSEAALYRHFPSKAKIPPPPPPLPDPPPFSRIPQILATDKSTQNKIKTIIELVLQFAEINPGICRIITGDALVGEHERLKKRSNQIVLRLETQLKQVLREAEHSENLRTQRPVGICVDLVMSVLDGKLTAYVRSGFERKRRENWPPQWEMIAASIFI